MVGRPMRDLAAMEDMAPILRSVVRGRQQIIFEHIRAPGEGVRITHGHLWAWGCNGGDCARDGLFMGRDPRGDLFYMLLIRDGELDRQVPPRGTAWPDALVEAVAPIRPDLVARLSRTN